MIIHQRCDMCQVIGWLNLTKTPVLRLLSRITNSFFVFDSQITSFNTLYQVLKSTVITVICISHTTYPAGDNGPAWKDEACPFHCDGLNQGWATGGLWSNYRHRNAVQL